MKKMLILALLVFSSTQIFGMEKKLLDGCQKVMNYLEKVQKGKVPLSDYLENASMNFLLHFQKNFEKNKNYTVVAVYFVSGEIKEKFILTGTGEQFVTAIKISQDKCVGFKFFKYFEGLGDRNSFRASIWKDYMDQVIVTLDGNKYVSTDKIKNLKRLEEDALKKFDESSNVKEDKKLVTLKDYAEERFNSLAKILKDENTYFLTFSKIDAKGKFDYMHSCNKGLDVKKTIAKYKKKEQYLIDFSDMSSMGFSYLFTNLTDKEFLIKFEKALVHKNNEVYVDTLKLKA